MSEIYVPVVTCDKCAPGELPIIKCGEFLTDIKDSSYCVSVGVEQLLEEDGWEEREYGHICPTCVAAEKQETEQDSATGVEHGAFYKETEEEKETN